MSDVDKLTRSIGAQVLPGVFRPGLQAAYPDYITATGYGSGYNNAMQEMEQRQFANAREAATASDADRAAKTIVSMFVLAAKASGRALSKEDMARIYQTAKVHGNNIEVYLGMARSLGLNEQGLNQIRRVFYTDKGSTGHLFDTTYGALKSRYGHGTALKMAENFAKYQYGSAYNKNFMDGMNADDFAQVHSFMTANGGLVGSGFGYGNGFALMSDEPLRQAIQTPSEDLSVGQKLGRYMSLRYSNTGWGQKNRQAFKMQTAELTKRIESMSGSDLVRNFGDKLTKGEVKAFSALDEFNNYMKGIKKEYQINLDLTATNSKKAVNKLKDDIDKQISKALKDGDDVQAGKLRDIRDNIAKIQEVVSTKSGEKDREGNMQTYGQLAQLKSGKAQALARQGMAEANAKYEAAKALQFQSESQMGAARRILGSSTSTEEERIAAQKKLDEAKQNRAKALTSLHDLEFTEAGKITLETRGSTEGANREKAFNGIAQAIKSSFAASGKQISVGEALQASKALVPLSGSTSDIRSMSEAIRVALAGVTSRNGSPEQFLAQVTSGKQIAAQYGIGDNQQLMNAIIAQDVNKYTAKQGLTDAQAAKVADDYARRLSENNYKGTLVAAFEHERSANNDTFNAKMEEIKKNDPTLYAKMEGILEKRNKGDVLSDEELSSVNQFLTSYMGVNQEDLENGSVYSEDVTAKNKMAFRQQQLGVLDTDVSNMATTSPATKIVGGGLDKQKNREAFIRFYGKNAKKIEDIVYGRGEYETMTERQRKEALSTLASTDQSLGEYANEIANSLANVDMGTMRNMSRYMTETFGSSAEMQPLFNSIANSRSDIALDQSEANLQMMFSGDDKQAIDKLMGVLASGKVDLKDPNAFAKAGTEILGHTLTEPQKKAIITHMLATGKFTTDMKYKDATGKIQNVTNKDITIGTESFKNADALQEWLRTHNDNDTYTFENGEEYTKAEILESNATQHLVSAAGQGMGMNKVTMDNMANMTAKDANKVNWKLESEKSMSEIDIQKGELRKELRRRQKEDPTGFQQMFGTDNIDDIDMATFREKAGDAAANEIETSAKATQHYIEYKQEEARKKGEEKSLEDIRLENKVGVAGDKKVQMEEEKEAIKAQLRKQYRTMSGWYNGADENKAITEEDFKAGNFTKTEKEIDALADEMIRKEREAKEKGNDEKAIAEQKEASKAAIDAGSNLGAERTVSAIRDGNKALEDLCTKVDAISTALKE